MYIEVEKIKNNFSTSLISILNRKELTKLYQRLERVCFKIAPLNKSTGNTSTINRWELTRDNYHFSSYEECLDIFESLLKDILIFTGISIDDDFKFHNAFFNGPPNLNDLKDSISKNSRIGSSELPITYENLNLINIHKKKNILWFKPSNSTINLENWINEKKIIEKIQVKAFLTDRRQTGDYQTNREFRWEAHPKSPQFATKEECIKIENKLISQIALFNNSIKFDKKVQEAINDILGHSNLNSFRCPISGKPIDFLDFKNKITSPIHGRSGYQIGHLDPIASTGSHSVENVSWITDLGNRVQGEESLEKITNEIFFMANYHKNRLGINWEDIKDKVEGV